MAVLPTVSSPVALAVGAGASDAASSASRPDPVSASITARLTKHRVEVASAETESSTTYANPDGTFTTQQAAGPIRVAQSDGSWKPLDLTLQPVAGALSPVASPVNVQFSSGGAGDAAVWKGPGGERFGLSWDSALPAPSVSGGVATYQLSNAMQLVLATTATGFNSHLVLTAAPTQASSLNLGLDLSKLSVVTGAGGGLQIKDSAGRAAAASQQLSMWDAQVDTAGDPLNVQPVPAQVTTDAAGRSSLDLSGAMKFLTDPNTKYPVTIDPTLAVPRNGDTDWYTDNGVGNTTRQDSNYNLLVGSYVSGTHTYVYRSWLNFDPTKIVGTHVTSATLSLYEYEAGSCTNQPTVFSFTTTNAVGTTVWGNQPSQTSTGQKTLSFNTGGAGCGTPNAYVDNDITSMMGYIGNGTLAWHGIELRAQTESNTAQGKRFCSMNPSSGTVCDIAGKEPIMSVTYNSYPTTATGLTLTPSVLGTTGYRYITSATPKLQAQVADADPNTTMTVTFEIDHDPAYSSEGTGLVWSGAAAPVPAGAVATATVPSGLLVDEHHYVWEARGNDGIDDGKAWSTPAKFKPNLTKPPAPTISCTNYPSGAWTATQPGPSDTCTLSTTAQDLAGFYYSFDNPDPTIAVPSPTSPATIHFPTTFASGWHTLYARTYDPAYNESTAITSYAFGVGTGGMSSPADGSSTQQAVTLSSIANPAEDGVTYNYRLGTSGSWVVVPTGDVTVPGTGNHPTWPQAISGGSFPALAWNVASTVTNASGDDGPVQLEACFSHAGTQDPCSTAATLTLARKAFGGSSATTNLGPGNLSLITGDLNVASTDVTVPTSNGTLSLGRSLTTLGPSMSTTGPTGIFGPAWTADLPMPDSGDADQTLADHTSQGYATLTDSSGVVSTYVTTNSTYPYTFTGIEDADDGSVLTKTDSTHFTLTDVDGTVTKWLYNSTLAAWQVTSIVQPGSDDTTSYTFDSTGRVSEVLAPVPAAVTCTSPKTTKGCRVLDLTYATTTTATSDDSSGWGNYIGRVSGVTYTAWDPATSAMKTTTVASYLYDTQGLLRAAWDPRISPALKTTYAYDANKRLTTLTPPGLNPWTINYDTAGRVASVSRTDPVNGTATQAVAYGVPITGSGAPVDLSSTQTATWAQTVDFPFQGAAVFPADHVPGLPNASGDYAPSSSDWPYGSLTYVDVNGRQVNSASYGAGAWQFDATRYDATGNVVWQLSAQNRADAVASTPSTGLDPDVAAIAAGPDRADALAQTSVYTADGVDLTDTYGPTQQVTLNDGTIVSARSHTHNMYDQGAPNGGPFHLVTTATAAAYFDDGSGTATDHDTRTTKTGYDPIDGKPQTDPTSGWVLRQPTTQTTVVDGGANDIVTKTRFDSDGNTVESRMPKATTGTDAYTTLTTYYTAAANATYPECGGHTEWAGKVCRSAPAAQPTSGPTVPVTETTYNYYDQPTTVTETSGTVTRTTTTTYDGAGRVQTVHVADTSTGATAIPDVTTGYDPATGLATTTSTSTQTITTGYDALGRVTSYTTPSASGTNTTSTSFDIDGRAHTVADGKGTVTYTYDGTDSLGHDEHRGLLTSEDTGMGSNPSTFTGAYNGDGNMISETYPNGLVATTRYDDAGNAIELNYAKSGTAWADFTQASSIFGQIRLQASPQSSQTFAYDPASRLSTVADAGDGTCVTRTYGYDLDSNRTTGNTYPADSTGACSQSTTPVTVSHSYDQVDRVNNTGYSYDSLGRSLTVPAGDTNNNAAGTVTLTYFADDMAHTQSQNGATDTWTLDPVERPFGQTESATGKTSTNIYSDSSDSPAWISVSDGSWSRNVEDLGGDLATIQNSDGTAEVQLSNLHGDVVATAADSASAVGLDSYFEDTEFGAPRLSNTVTPAHYGWLGAKRRSTDALAGLVLMGKRQYNPATGRFLSTDPVQGGSANAYDYVNQDPVNDVDLNGTHCHWCHRLWHKATHLAGKAVDLVSVGVYAVYYGSYEIRHHSPWYLRWSGLELPLLFSEAWGLAGDALLDEVERHTYKHRERVNDEGVRGHILPHWLHHGGPKTYLPGIHHNWHVNFE